MSGPSPRAVLGMLHSQLFVHPQPVVSTFEGQTILVTGGNAGLGKETARMLVTLKAETVIIAVRSVTKGQNAKKEIEATTKRPGVVQVWPLDLADYASVIAFGQKISTLSRLDAAILNAGTWPTQHTVVHGHELTLLTNVISTFLVAHLVLPKLRSTAGEFSTTGRMTVVGSTLHKFATLSARSVNSDNLISALDQQELKTSADFDMRYNDTKLLVQLYGQRLASHHESEHGRSVCITVVNPGYCKSALKPPVDFTSRLIEKTLARTTDEGAYALVDAVVLQKALNRHGQYIDNQTIQQVAPWIKTEEGQRTTDRLWKELNVLLTGIVPELTLS